MKEWSYQKSLKFTKGLQEHSPIWMEMMKRRKRRKNVYDVLKEEHKKFKWIKRNRQKDSEQEDKVHTKPISKTNSTSWV